MNLHGFLELARIGQKVDVNLWDTISKDGRSIKKGYQFMVPFLTNEKKWEYKQIIDKTTSEEKLISDLNYISTYLKDSSFDAVIEQLNQ